MEWSEWIAAITLLLGSLIPEEEAPADHDLWTDLISIRDACLVFDARLQRRFYTGPTRAKDAFNGLTILCSEIRRLYPGLTYAESTRAQDIQQARNRVFKQLNILLPETMETACQSR